jgi:hypothetical protein
VIFFFKRVGEEVGRGGEEEEEGVPRPGKNCTIG